MFAAMFKHGLRLPIYPKVQSMLVKLGYAPGQYNLNFWIILDRVYIAWWLAKLGEPTFEQFMHLYSVSRQNSKFSWVQTNCIEAKKIGYFVVRMLSSQKTLKKKWCFSFEDWEGVVGRVVDTRVPTDFQTISFYLKPLVRVYFINHVLAIYFPSAEVRILGACYNEVRRIVIRE